MDSEARQNARHFSETIENNDEPIIRGKSIMT